jgi:hypothetical protein
MDPTAGNFVRLHVSKMSHGNRNLANPGALALDRRLVKRLLQLTEDVLHTALIVEVKNYFYFIVWSLTGVINDLQTLNDR